jgi:hypothetical protein
LSSSGKLNRGASMVDRRDALKPQAANAEFAKGADMRVHEALQVRWVDRLVTRTRTSLILEEAFAARPKTLATSQPANAKVLVMRHPVPRT